MPIVERRKILTLLAGGTAAALVRVGFAAAPGQSRFVLVLLRGALDGLAVVPPYGDPDYARLRGPLALSAPGHGDTAARPLDGLFGLHPQLAFLHESYAARELLVCHATASPYRERSHFDGQDVLESGALRPHTLASGWLNRALEALPARGVRHSAGVALGQSVPLVLRGAVEVASWSPAHLAGVDQETLQRLSDLYAPDARLAERFADALSMDALATHGVPSADEAIDGSAMEPREPMLQGAGVSRAAGPAVATRYAQLVRTAAELLRREDGPRVAVFDTLGWDTHANEGGARGVLATRLAALDGALRLLKEQMGPVWRETAVVLVTEFGRTAAVNGTRGTDHGTATAAFLLGGAVRGGRVLADWPGLSARTLYQQRDLAPTLDLRSLLKGVLAEHLGLSDRALNERVFLDSAGARPLRDLMRA
jgi:uncharacterized protein (DUF1501 family)